MERPNEAIYCLNFWRNKFHGKSDDEPYFDVVEGGFQSGKKMRVYVDARRFPTWSEWKTEADKARACAYVGESTLHGYFIKSGTAYPLSAAPPFMIEAAPASYLDPILWINVLCPSESEFHWAVAEAKNAAELKSKKLGPSELYAPFCNVQYPHKEVLESELEAFCGKWNRNRRSRGGWHIGRKDLWAAPGGYQEAAPGKRAGCVRVRRYAW